MNFTQPRLLFLTLVFLGTGLWPRPSQAGFLDSQGGAGISLNTLNSPGNSERSALKLSNVTPSHGLASWQSLDAVAVRDLYGLPDPEQTSTIPEPASLLLVSVGAMILVAPRLRSWARPSGLT